VSWLDHISGPITENIAITRIRIVNLEHEWAALAYDNGADARPDDRDSKTHRTEQRCDTPVVTLWDDSA